MALQVDFAAPAQALPNSGGLLFQTPEAASWQSSPHGSSSPFASPSPAPGYPGERAYSRDKDICNDENVFALDPRRFTPNLHASLVSEILSLRREVESKNTALERLEENLHDSRAENGQLNESLRTQTAEARSVKRQIQLLETGTLSALGELAKERDEAVENLSDTQKRLEATKYKARAHEDEAGRTHGLWERDRQAWDDEKRNLERKVHVVEGRLKTVLTEVAAAQANAAQQLSSNELDHGMRETWFTNSSDSTSNQLNSVRGRSRFSGLSNNTQDGSDVPNSRISTLSELNEVDATKLNGLSLAEELEFDDEEEDNLEDFDIDGGLASPDALPEEAQMRHRRNSSVQSQSQDQKARKILGLLTGSNERLMQEESTTEKYMKRIDEKTYYPPNEPAPEYKDTGTQFSPPLSPKSSMQDADTLVEKNVEQTENTANQRRKRVSIASITLEQPTFMKPGTSAIPPMVSIASQTLEPLSPPLTPLSTNAPSIPTAILTNRVVEMKSSATQTNEDIIKVSTSTHECALIMVPTIAIHPPASRPTSSHTSVVLPPRTKSVACQVSIDFPGASRSVAVQTEQIRADRRPLKIPPRLTATTVPSKPSNWRHDDLKDSARNQVGLRQSSRKNFYHPSEKPPLPRAGGSTEETVDSYPGNNDNGPLNKLQSSDLRRPIRKESLFAGFESASDEEAPAIPDTGFSDDDFATAAPIRKTLSKVQNSWKLVPRAKILDMGLLRSDKDGDGSRKLSENIPPPRESSLNKRQLPAKTASTKPSVRPPIPFHAAKEPSIRRTALISSGAAAHTTRARSPSVPAASNKGPSAVAPPFPVPTRSSSRRIPISASDGARSPTPYATSFFGAAREHRAGGPPSRSAILRKVRSATAVPKFGRSNGRQSRSRSPPPSTSTLETESPRLPRLPQHETFPRPERQDQKPPDMSSLSSVTPPVTEEPSEFPNQSSRVVDAIAQTMVGGWMWKYVRRRKSFGISESPQVEFDSSRSNGEIGAGSGIRHKRWVWLAPYERAIMWSSKQPTSGSALLGKGGRKLAIQSVLDVKDDTPMPKNSDSPSPFNRSILILTPQRALKFTATSSERHLVWLTALSFLSQSTLGINDLTDIPSVPRQDYLPPLSRDSNGFPRRTPFFDSIRTAKPKGRPLLDGNRAFTSPLVLSHTGIDEERAMLPDDDINLGAAEAPHVPRVSSHSRKRSSTGPRSGPPSISHTFTNKATMSSSNINLQASISREAFSAFQRGNPGIADSNTGGSHVIRNNFFDAVGTVRMEAFIDEGEKRTPPRRKESRAHRAKQCRKKDLSYWGVGGPIGPDQMVQPGDASRWRGDDPFKGF